MATTYIHNIIYIQRIHITYTAYVDTSKYIIIISNKEKLSVTPTMYSTFLVLHLLLNVV